MASRNAHTAHIKIGVVPSLSWEVREWATPSYERSFSFGIFPASDIYLVSIFYFSFSKAFARFILTNYNFWVVHLFTDLRLQLLESESNHYIVKTLYSILMLLPQSDAFRTLQSRLQCVSQLHQPKYASLMSFMHRKTP